MLRLTFKGFSDDEKVNPGPDGAVLSLLAGIVEVFGMRNEDGVCCGCWQHFRVMNFISTSVISVLVNAVNQGAVL